jgi:glutathione gamma-glutamylcysteinyltransferase
MNQSFYRRPLPEICIDFSSIEGKQIFREAMASGHMENYFGIAAQFQTQEEPGSLFLFTLFLLTLL